MHFYNHPLLVLRQMHMMVRSCSPSGPIDQLQQFVAYKPHFPEQGDHTLTTTLHPDVDIAGLASHRVGIEPSVSLSF